MVLLHAGVLGGVQFHFTKQTKKGKNIFADFARILKGRKKHQAQVATKNTAEHDSTAPHGSRAPQDTAVGGRTVRQAKRHDRAAGHAARQGHPCRITPPGGNTRQPDAATNTQGQQAATPAQPAHPQQQPAQHPAAASARETKKHRTGRNDAGTPAQHSTAMEQQPQPSTSTAPDTARSNAAQHRAKLHDTRSTAQKKRKQQKRTTETARRQKEASTAQHNTKQDAKQTTLQPHHRQQRQTTKRRTLHNTEHHICRGGGGGGGQHNHTVPTAVQRKTATPHHDTAQDTPTQSSTTEYEQPKTTRRSTAKLTGTRIPQGAARTGEHSKRPETKTGTAPRDKKQRAQSTTQHDTGQRTTPGTTTPQPRTRKEAHHRTRRRQNKTPQDSKKRDQGPETTRKPPTARRGIIRGGGGLRGQARYTP